MSTSQKLEKIHAFLGALREANTTLDNRPDSEVDKYFSAKIDEWANKILGISSGYEAEFNQMYKHRIHKARSLSEGFADVTVGEPGEIHAKSIQLKSTVQDDHSKVNAMIKAALNQLSGERGEQPRIGDRLVVDMNIQNAENTWPAGANTLGSLNYNTYEMMAKQRLVELCTAYRPHVASGSGKQEGFGLNAATLNRLTDVAQKPVQQLGKVFSGHSQSTQLVTPVHGQHHSAVDKVIHLTIKIRYHFGYPVVVGINFSSKGDTVKYRFLHLAVFNIVRSGNTLNITLAKTQFFDHEHGLVSALH